MKQWSFLQRVGWRPIVITVTIALVLVGLLSRQAIREEIAELLAQRHYLRERCTSIDWSPDRTQFILSSGCPGINSVDLVVYGIDGTMQHRIRSSYYGFAFWSPDGQYVAVKTCEGSHTDTALEYTVYDASSWDELCVVGSGAGMICSPFDRECSLPLRDGRRWLLTGYQHRIQIDTSICDNADKCPTTSQ